MAPKQDERLSEKEEKARIQKELEDLKKEERDTEALEEEKHPDWSPCRQRTFAFLENQKVEYALCIIIVSNLILLIIETDSTDADGNSPFWIEVVNNVMLSFFTLELAM